MHTALRMKEAIINFFKEYSENIYELFLALFSWAAFSFGVEDTEDFLSSLRDSIPSLRIVVENPEQPKTFLDKTEQFLSILSFLFSIGASLFAVIRFIIKTKKKLNS